MKQNFRWKQVLPLCLFILVILNIAIWSGFIIPEKKPLLSISFLDIGQGDAIYIEAPNGKQMLVDGGPDKATLLRLKKVMPFFDRSLDVLVVTNPDKDHIGGFIDVLRAYEVALVVEPGTISKTETYKVLTEKIESEKAEKVIARRGQEIVLDSEQGVKLVILFPDRDVKALSTNDGSIIAKLVYGDTSVMLQGDAPQEMERYVMSLEQKEKGDIAFLDSDILKVGHHGSYTSSDRSYVEALSPFVAVASLGKDNRYGHPHKETLETFETLGVPLLRTDEEGTITFVSDGVGWKRK
jgi:competence protein ComEC